MSSMTKRSHFFQAEMRLLISSTDISSEHIIIVCFKGLVCQFVFHSQENFIPYGVIHRVTVRTLWRPFILLDEFWCGLRQKGLAYPTCTCV